MLRPNRGNMRMSTRPPAAAPRRGLTLIGLLAWAIMVGFVGYLLVRVVPTVTEFYTIKGVVDRIAASPASTVAEIRGAFDKQRQIDATITSLVGKELDITKENDRVVISFAYEKEIELFGPVFLLIKYAGRSR
jgi:hypothetical protein